MLDLHAATAFCPPAAPPGGVEVVLGALVVGAVLGAVVLAPPVREEYGELQIGTSRQVTLLPGLP